MEEEVVFCLSFLIMVIRNSLKESSSPRSMQQDMVVRCRNGIAQQWL